MSNKNCIWNSKKCEEYNTKQNNETNIIQISSLKKCFEQEDFETSVFIKKYCGNINYEYKKNNKILTISIPQNNQFYGINPLYCEYTIINYDEIKSLTVQTKKKWGSLFMQIQYMDSGEDKELIFGDEEKNIINKPKIIKIIFSSNEIKENQPFSVKIYNTLLPANITLIIEIIFLIFLGFIVAILIFICVKRQKKNTIIIQHNRNNNYIINNKNILGSNSDRVLINYVNKIKPVKFKDIKNKVINKNCPVEREPFEDNSDVIFFSCYHAIHYDCLKEHISKNQNLKELKCFYCNRIYYKLNENYSIIYDSQNFM